MTLALHYALRSDVGLLREGNEDSAYAGPHLLAIADGMGGHAAGEVASAVAISALAPLDRDTPDHGEMLNALSAAVTAANNTLHEMSTADPSTEGMGTTLTAILWSGGAQFGLCHIGDSRAYLLRDGEFYQITHDHTLVQTLVDEGRLSPEAAATHPQRSWILRALQSSTVPEPDLSLREALLGDRYLLCSDGLSDVVTEQTIHKTLVTLTDADEAVRRLIDLANRAGGPDNITCIVADVVDTVGGPVAPSRSPVLAGAAANGDGRPDLRADSPAERARALMQTTARVGGSAGLDTGGPGPATTRGPATAAAGGPGPADDDEPDEGDGEARRRWPIVTSILAILILVIAGGGYAAWRYTQNQYYVGTDGQQVIIYRGLDQKVAGVSLSSIYRRTGIPVGHVTASDRAQLPTASGTLVVAERTVHNIKHGYQCQQAYSALQKWQANKPKPTPTKSTHSKHSKHSTHTKPTKPTKPYPPPPKVPANCPAQGSG